MEGRVARLRADARRFAAGSFTLISLEIMVLKKDTIMGFALPGYSVAALGIMSHIGRNSNPGEEDGKDRDRAG